MKYTTTTLSLLALALSSTSSAQSLADVPACARNPAIASFASSGCGVDIPCICKNQNFINSLLPVVQRDCSPEDFQSIPASFPTPFPLPEIPQPAPASGAAVLMRGAGLAGLVVAAVVGLAM